MQCNSYCHCLYRQQGNNLERIFLHHIMMYYSIARLVKSLCHRTSMIILRHACICLIWSISKSSIFAICLFTKKIGNYVLFRFNCLCFIKNLFQFIIDSFFQDLIHVFKGGHLSENGQNDQISVFCSKSVFRHGGITSQIFRGLAALEPPQNGGQRGEKGGRFIFFFVFNRKRKRK